MKKNHDQDVRHFLQNKFDPESQLKKLKSYSNAFQSPLYETDLHETYQIQILPDLNVRPALFIPTLNPRVYKAHPTTIKAMRKEIFMGEEDFVDLECIEECRSCKTKLDLQFWKFCPYCESSFNG